LSDESRILVKGRLPSADGAFSIGARKFKFKAEPLMPSIGASEPGMAGLAPAQRTQWHALKFERNDTHPWDVCHQAFAEGFGYDAALEAAEPDLEQEWKWMSSPPAGAALKGICDGDPKPQRLRPYEGVPGDDLWFLKKTHSGLADARKAVRRPDEPGRRIRIAHLDTGYDPDHRSLPPNLFKELQRNFVDKEDPNDATDRNGGIIIPSFGHGVATLALLAGGSVTIGGVRETLGGAAAFDVVPLRVANSVVLFRTSSVAKALNYVHELSADPQTQCHIVTMSMGGLASAAWADAVNALYDRGVFVVTAAGNNFGNLPTRFIVYPARFHRVVAACGVMAQGSPYADLPNFVMQGCYGPRSKMSSAISGFTPNVPWAIFGCETRFNFDGGGTSSATPQVAAAAALWMQMNFNALAAFNGDEAWKRVELTRQALFGSADASGNLKKLGAGALKAHDALRQTIDDLPPVAKQPRDDASFALLRGIFGRSFYESGLAPPASQAMLELEALQISQRSRDIEAVLDEAENNPQSDNGLSRGQAARVLEALAASPNASSALRAALDIRLKKGARRAETKIADEQNARPVDPRALTPPVPRPKDRYLRVYAFDPSLAANLETLHLNEAVIPIKWEEDLQPGPVGEYVEVVDLDPASGAAYAPVDLNDPALIAQNGLAPTEGNPQFHQQMVYAVAMRTIGVFEKALGRNALWSERAIAANGKRQLKFVRRLRLYPHALREANAYYSPPRKAILFGYFNAADEDVGSVLPGGLVFTSLSHDIIAHEVSHALLDGLHPRFGEPTNADMLAFHEAFADIVALFQHFMIPEALEDQIAKTRGDLWDGHLLGGLAVQFGMALKKRGALRNAIAEYDGEKWTRRRPDKNDYQRHDEPHARGAVLVSAIFDAFLRIYQRDAEPLVRLATNGSGVLPPGAISPHLASMLAQSAAKIAGRVLNICIRALDYCPPVSLTFGEYLRAIITADREIVPNDVRGYRVAFISAFRDRGVYPADVTNLSVDTLAWQRPAADLSVLEAKLKSLSVDWDLKSDRYEAYLSSNQNAAKLHRHLIADDMPDAALSELGILKTSVERPANVDGVAGEISRIEVHSMRPARRIGPSDLLRRELIIELTQKWTPNADKNARGYRGGCTIIYDPDEGRIRYVIRKRVGHRIRAESEAEFRAELSARSRLANYFSAVERNREPFALIHRL